VTSEEQLLAINSVRVFSIALMTSTIAILNNESIPISEELILTGIASEDIIIADIRERVLLR
jgi:hypothetical protein